MKRRALCIVPSGVEGLFFIHEARAGQPSGEALAGPMTRVEAEAERFELMKAPPPKAPKEGRAPRNHAPPSLARSRVR